MAKERLFNLQETKGTFQLKGITTGTQSQNFCREITTKSGKQMRIVNVGVQYADGKTPYISLQGMERDEVIFVKSAEEKGQKASVERVPWADRNIFNREGFRLMGVNVGVKKKLDETGKVVNDKKVLTEYDACGEIRDNLKDGNSVFVRGNLNYSSFFDNDKNKRTSIKLVPNQVSLCADIDFDDETYTQQNDFKQTIVYMGISKETNDANKETGRFVVSAKIVTYSTIEDVEFIIEDSKLANLFKTKLKKYWAIQVHGRIEVSVLTEEVTDDDDNWGEEDKMERVSAPVRREFIITGAKPSTIDKELYTEDSMNEAYDAIANAQKAESDYNAGEKKSDWGLAANIDDDEEEAW